MFDTWGDHHKDISLSDFVTTRMTELSTYGKDGKYLKRKIVEERFLNIYQERAQEIGTDALLLLLAKKRKYRYGTSVSTGTSFQTHGLKEQLYLKAIKFDD